MLTFDNPHPVTFRVNQETRTIRGLALPFGDVGNNGYAAWSFAKGTLTWGKVKVLDGHDWSKAVGVAELTEGDQGVEMTARIARGARGDEVLALAEDGVYDGLSIGLGEDTKFDTVDGVNHVTEAVVQEVSLTPIPAFERASVTSVAASAAPTKEGRPAMGDTDSKTPEVAPKATETVTPAGADFSSITDAIAQGFAGLTAGFPPREVVPAAGPTLHVQQPPMYRFDGYRGEHEFSTDLFDALKGNRDAHARIDQFIGQQFATASTDVGALNPARHRPDLYVDSDPVVTPVYEALYKGGLTDATPFVAPKFSSATGLVSDHVEGTEPTSGNWKATSQTVTPGAVSGEVDITREVIDAGGSPQVSGLIWAEIQKAYDTALETKSAALLNDATITITELGTAPAVGSADDILVGTLTANLGTLPFLPYGSSFGSNVLTHVDLYTAMLAAQDADGRKLLPVKGPVNSDGSAGDRLQSIDLAGYKHVPTASLGATGVNQKSYTFDSSFGGVWASNAQRISLNPSVAYGARVGVFGYVATAVLNAARIRKITYDNVA